jgi:4-amino-4-deoxy-L-arabinose transferase-like glycosyltransferase
MKQLREISKEFLTGSSKNQLAVVAAVTVVMFIADLISHGGGLIMRPDSISYFQEGENMTNGIFPFLRTPVYPFLYYSLVNAFGGGGMYMLSLLQLAMLMISEICLYKATETVSGKKWLSFVAAAIYGWRFETVSETMVILTESLSVSLFAILIYYIVEALYNTNKRKPCLMIGVVMAVMLMLKPFFICLLPVVIIVYLWCAWSGSRATRMAAAFGTIIIIAPYIAYCAAFQQNYGIFSTSSVGTNNLRFTLCQVDSSLQKENDSQNNFLAFKSENDKLLKTHSGEVVRMKAALMSNYVFSTYSVFPSWNKYPATDASHFHPFALVSFIIATAYFAGIIAIARRKQWKLTVFRFAILLSVIAIFFTAFAGADNSYNRLLSPAYPALVMMTAWIISAVAERYKAKE